MKRWSFILLLSFLLCGCTVRKAEALPPEAAAAPGTETAATPVPDSLRCLRITEVMADNASPYGEFRSWIELTNTGSEAVELTDCALSDKAEEPMKWRFPALRLEGGERLIVYGDSGAGGGLCADFSLSAKRESLTLSAPDGTTLHRVSWEDAPENQSVCFEGEESRFCPYPTPGKENTFESWVLLQESEESDSPLRINEAMSSNQSLMPQSDGACYDWVELKNVSAQPLELSGYYLSDSLSNAKRYALPPMTLQPGELWLAFCEKDAEAETLTLPATGFALDAQAENLYLFDENGRCLDWLYLWNIPRGGSMGRKIGENGSFYFLSPTPGAENGGECGRSRYPAPVGDVPSGVYENSKPLTLSLSGEGELHYTLDGSLPDENSPVYREPLTLDRSTVVRVVALGSERLPSSVTTLHYILNEDETLEVVSLAAPPEKFWEFYGGFDKEREEAVNAAYFGEYGSFTEDAGVTFHGNSELTETGKQKSMTLRFRSRFGSDHVHCDLFGVGEEKLRSLVLRTGISREYYFLSDPLYTMLTEEWTEELELMRCDFVSVYVNGEYLGFFQLRDHLSRHHFAEKWSVPKESVEIVSLSESDGTALEEDLQWMNTHDLSIPENAGIAAQLFNLHSLAQWVVAESYCANADLRLNVKFARSPLYNEGRWEVLLFDLDRSMLADNPLDNVFATGGGINALLPGMLGRLALCEPFRQELLQALSDGKEVLTTEHTLSVLDGLRSEYEGELLRSLNRWEYEVPRYQAGIAQLRSRIELWNVPMLLRRSSTAHFSITQEEQDTYLGDWGTGT